jgi:hypothetical protein
VHPRRFYNFFRSRTHNTGTCTYPLISFIVIVIVTRSSTLRHSSSPSIITFAYSTFPRDSNNGLSMSFDPPSQQSPYFGSLMGDSFFVPIVTFGFSAFVVVLVVCSSLPFFLIPVRLLASFFSSFFGAADLLFTLYPLTLRSSDLGCLACMLACLLLTYGPVRRTSFLKSTSLHPSMFFHYPPQLFLLPSTCTVFSTTCKRKLSLHQYSTHKERKINFYSYSALQPQL